MNGASTEFSSNGYRIVRGLLPEPARAFAYEYARKAALAGRLDPGDSDVPGAPNRYADPFMESILKILLPRIAEESGLSLYPTYSYFRVYGHGDVLKVHRDRPSCEVSVTVNLGYEGNAAWPVWVEAGGAARRIDLEPGDAMLYKGTELPHWRERFDGVEAVQVFLHYVDRHGPHEAWKFDRRPDLNTSAAAERMMSVLMRQSGG